MAGKKRKSTGTGDEVATKQGQATEQKAPKEYGGYKIVFLPLPHGAGYRYMYLKEHRDKTGEAQGRTLFMSNVPPFFKDEQIIHLFKGVKIESVRIGANKPGTARIAHVVFTSTKGLQRSLASSWTLSEEEMYGSDTLTGYERYLAHYKEQRPDPDLLLDQVNSYIDDFEAQEEERKQELKRKASEPDEDGFVMVTRKKKPRMEEEKKKRKKKKPKELQNFYRFQMREQKRNRLMELREKFEEDKKRIAQLKAARRFKPQ